MIKGKAKIEYGTGDIRMTSLLSKDFGALCLETQLPHEIGKRVPIDYDNYRVEDSQVILTFTKLESIDALIDELQCIKSMMKGTYQAEKLHCLGNVDFDSFMENQHGK